MNFGIVLFMSILCMGKFEENTTLKLVLVLFRHGDRTPLSAYKNDPHQYWPEGWGKLTIKGKNEMYNLGKMLRNQYSKFISEYYNENEVYVRSSDVPRCIMSAQLVLAGLFPPIGKQVWNPQLLWQPIPVLYDSYYEDNLLGLHKPCKMYQEEVLKKFNSETMRNLMITHKDLFEYLTHHTGEEIKDIYSIHRLYNTLEIEQQHNLELPAWTNRLSWNVMYKLAALKLFIFSDTLLMQRYTGGVFLKDLINHFTQRSKNDTNLKIIVYSGHDSTLVTVLQTLGFRELFIPDYGAHLLFELHKTNNGSYEIRALTGKNFNSTATPLELNFCKSPCMLSKFEEELQLRNLLPVNWDLECSNSTFM